MLETDGALHLMVYAPYGRAGVYLLQDYCRRLGIGYSQQEIRDLAATLTALPLAIRWPACWPSRPTSKARMGWPMRCSTRRIGPTACRSVFDWLERCGLRFGRWLRQAPYLAQCGSLAGTPHAARLAALPPMEQYAAVELWRGNMLRHSLIAYRADRPGDRHLPRFDGDDWLGYRPLRLPETISVRERLPAGVAAALINRSHSDPDLVLFVDAAELQLVEAIDGRRSIADIVQRLVGPASPRRKLHEQARNLFQRLWWYDQVVFDTSHQNDVAGDKPRNKT